MIRTVHNHPGKRLRATGILALCVGLASLTACGGSDGAAPATGSSDPENGSTTSVAPIEGVVTEPTEPDRVTSTDPEATTTAPQTSNPTTPTRGTESVPVSTDPAQPTPTQAAGAVPPTPTQAAPPATPGQTPTPPETAAELPTGPLDTSLPDAGPPINERGIPLVLDEAGFLACANVEFGRDSLTQGDQAQADEWFTQAADRAAASTDSQIAAAADSLRQADTGVAASFLDLCVEKGHQL